MEMTLLINFQQCLFQSKNRRCVSFSSSAVKLPGEFMSIGTGFTCISLVLPSYLKFMLYT